MTRLEAAHHTIPLLRHNRVAGLRRNAYSLTEVVAGAPAPEPLYRGFGDTITIGRGEGNSARLDAPGVSLFHARLELDAHGYLLTDLDSTNGTYVEGRRTRSTYLVSRDRITVGERELVFQVDDCTIDLEIGSDERYGRLVGCSPAMRRLFGELESVSSSDLTVLLHGESGSGKDIVAQEIHAHSPRADQPFVVVDCGALPPNLVESELFGHVRGAFTGADTNRKGAFEEAHGGTLFLDEVAELPLSVQSKLLRALDARTIKRIGSETWTRVDIRIIAASHQDLARRCNQGTFREDLYYRLSVAKLRIPPLRERPEDFGPLVQAMIADAGNTGQLVVDEDLLAALRLRHWAGNARELRNFVERASVFGKSALSDPSGERSTTANEESFKVAKARAVSAFEKQFLLELLLRFAGNVTGAARAAELDPAWLFQLVKRHKIDVARFRKK